MLSRNDKEMFVLMVTFIFGFILSIGGACIIVMLIIRALF